MTHAQRRMTIALLVTAWLGAAILLATAVAPAAFAALPSRVLAGDVVGRVLPAVFASGAIVGLIVFGLSMGRGGWRITMAAVMTVATGTAQFVISPRIARLREDMGGLMDTIAPADPRRVLFGKLHGASVGLLGVAMIAALVILILTLLALQQRLKES
jgi:hypothetical protein